MFNGCKYIYGWILHIKRLWCKFEGQNKETAELQKDRGKEQVTRYCSPPLKKAYRHTYIETYTDVLLIKNRYCDKWMYIKEYNVNIDEKKSYVDKSI